MLKLKSILKFIILLPLLPILQVTPKNGTITFLGQSGQRYPVSVYVSDVIGAAVTFEKNSGLAGAASSTMIQLPEPCVMVDYSQTTGPTVATAMEPRISSDSKGILDFIAHVSTDANRPPLAIAVPGMAIVTAVQR